MFKSCRQPLAVALFLCGAALACASARAVIHPGTDLNRFRHVLIEYSGNDPYNTVAELSRRFLEEGIQPVSEAQLRIMGRSQLTSLLVCNVKVQSSSIRAVVDLTCSDARMDVVYAGTGTYGMGWDYGGDARGAAARAFEGFAERYSGYVPAPAENPPDDPALRDERGWATAAPLLDEVLHLTEKDFNPSKSEDPIAGLAEAVVAISGEAAEGTAVLISRQGLALTNHHVVEGQSMIVARSRGGVEWPVRVLRSNEAADVALLEVACAPDCITAPLAPTTPRPGTDVLLYGNPLGLQNSLSRGIVSGLRLYRGVTLVQTDASMSPGNSGGPMVDLETGEVVAIVSLKIVGEGVEGLGFGITVGDALRVVGIVR